MYNVGEIIIATNLCQMSSGEQTLTIGKQYEIIATGYDQYDNNDYIEIIDDDNGPHQFPLNNIKDWFVSLRELRNTKLNNILDE